MSIDGKHIVTRRLFRQRRNRHREQARSVLPFRSVVIFFISHAIVRYSSSTKWKTVDFYVWETAASSQCAAANGDDKKHRDSMARREIGRQIDRRVVKPRRLGEDAVFLNLVLTCAPLFLSLFTIFVSRCRSRILFRREIHLARKSVLIYLVARKRITFVTATAIFLSFFLFGGGRA